MDDITIIMERITIILGMDSLGCYSASSLAYPPAKLDFSSRIQSHHQQQHLYQ